MKISEIKECLCIGDERNPDYMANDDVKNSECCCDNCFNGRHELANELLDSFDEINELREELDEIKDELRDSKSDLEIAEDDLSDYESKVEYYEDKLSKTDKQFDLIGCILNER